MLQQIHVGTMVVVKYDKLPAWLQKSPISRGIVDHLKTQYSCRKIYIVRHLITHSVCVALPPAAARFFGPGLQTAYTFL